jgi:hypothetical protein
MREKGHSTFFPSSPWAWAKPPVEVVRHQTPSQDPHRRACTGLLDKFDEPLVDVIIVKHILPRVAAVQNVIANPSDGSSCGSWHRTMLA